MLQFLATLAFTDIILICFLHHEALVHVTPSAWNSRLTPQHLCFRSQSRVISALGRSCLTHSQDQMLEPGLSAGTLLKKEEKWENKKRKSRWDAWVHPRLLEYKGVDSSYSYFLNHLPFCLLSLIMKLWLYRISRYCWKYSKDWDETISQGWASPFC